MPGIFFTSLFHDDVPAGVAWSIDKLMPAPMYPIIGAHQTYQECHAISVITQSNTLAIKICTYMLEIHCVKPIVQVQHT